MSQEMKVKMMSVNLALKREVAYRQKLARLYPNDDSIKHFSPLQIPSAAKNLSPNQGSTHSLGQSSHPTEAHQISITNPPCQKPSSSAIIVSPNSSSTLVVESISLQQSIFPNASTEFAQHQAVLLNSNMAPTYSTTKESVSNDTNLFCKVCKVSCLSSFNYKQHVRGQKHKSKLKMQQQQQQPRCNLCQIWCTDENNLKLHFDGQKHSAKLKETELQQKRNSIASAASTVV